MDDKSMEQIPSHPPPPMYEADNSSIDENAYLLSRRSIQDENTDGARGAPLQLQSPPKGASEVATFFNFAKASVGSGSFALPWGILQCGVLLGSAGMILLGIVSVYTMQLILECKKRVGKNLSPEQAHSLTFTDIGNAALGLIGKWSVNIAVLCCNLGVCAGYMIFISSNLQWSFTCLSENTSHGVCFTSWEIYAIILPVLILLTYLPSFRFLAYAAYVGSVFLAIAMVVVYVYGGENEFCAVKGVGGQHVRYLPEEAIGVAQWFGVTAFLFCVHSMVIPLESSMKRPKNMPLVLDFAALVVVGLNIPFAVYGYLLFGNITQGYIFENLPGGLFNDIVRLFLSLELTLTFPIVFKPASDVMEEIWYNFLMFLARVFHLQEINEICHSDRVGYKVIRYLMICSIRTLLVLISWGVAIGIPRFELCLALVGSFATSTIAFVLPPLFHLSLFWRDGHQLRRHFHSCFLFVGVLVTLLATGINLYMAIKGHSSPVTCDSIKWQCHANFTDVEDHCFSQ